MVLRSLHLSGDRWNDWWRSGQKCWVHWKCQCHDLCIWMCSWCNGLPSNRFFDFFSYSINQLELKFDTSIYWQGWGVAVLVGVPNKDDAFKTHPVNLLNGRTLKGTFFGNYKPRSDIPGVVEKYMKKVKYFCQILRSVALIFLYLYVFPKLFGLVPCNIRFFSIWLVIFCL